MANQKLSQLTALAEAPAETDQFYINDDGVSKSIATPYVQQYVKGQKLQSFTFSLRNTSGTLQHEFMAIGNAQEDSNFADRINGATTILTDTPTGPDATTAMAAGGKISTNSGYSFLFDVEDQVAGDILGSVNLAFNDTGSNIFVRLYSWSFDVNGVTRRRISLDFYNATNGSPWSLNTSNIGAGTKIWVNVLAYIR